MVLEIPKSTIFFYSKPGCMYCGKLEAELKMMQVEFCVVDIDKADYEELFKLTHIRTFPQLFIGTSFVGGYNEFCKLQMTGVLDEMLKPFNIFPESLF